MQTPPRRPANHLLLICTNRRPLDNPLGPGCASRGDELHAVLQRMVLQHGLSSQVWLARTSCLGLCPRSGAAVALAAGGTLLTEVTPSDALSLLERLPSL
ncbi:MAG: (2Fe-2S) ferredoxin domain-containing protein [Myxococcales bacterium]|nr:(2Fe-2S) ferredoxin domain-containing protein [Polyangiaceae bacterium]MDW8248918.1 (2Fe-2S) ferredoxin domain-containing protein [Myxococcales bacterium]